MTSASAQCTSRTQCPLTLRCFNLSCAGFATRCVYTKKWDSPFHLWAFAEDRTVQKKWAHPFHPGVFSNFSVLAAPHRVCTRKNGTSHFTTGCFLLTGFPCQGSFPPKVTRTYLLCPKNLWEAAFPKSFSKCTSEHPAVYRGAISECSSCFGSLQEGKRYPRPEVGDFNTEIQSRYPSARLFRQKTG